MLYFCNYCVLFDHNCIYFHILFDLIADNSDFTVYFADIKLPILYVVRTGGLLLTPKDF